MKRILLSFFFIAALLPSLSGQIAGEGVFNFLRFTNSAKVAALGGIQVALPDADPELLLQNPALLAPAMNNMLSVNYAKYLAGIGFGYGAYAREIGKFGIAAVGIQFAEYGQFVAADETGQITGSFSASDYALTFTWGKSFDSLFTVGASLKPVYSHLENYQSFGIAADVGIVRHADDQRTTIAICIKNIGGQLTNWYDGATKEKTYWSLQLGCTRKLQYAPLRFSITAYDLNRWKNAAGFTDPNGIASTKADQSVYASVMRHLSLGAEIFPENKITFRIGYNYRRHQDLYVADQAGLAGFTTGLGINLPALRFSYSLSGYYMGGMVQNFSLSANLSRLQR